MKFVSRRIDWVLVWTCYSAAFNGVVCVSCIVSHQALFAGLTGLCCGLCSGIAWPALVAK